MIHRTTLCLLRACLAGVVTAAAASAPAAAQSVSLGADVVSRYIWRGLDFGESASIQPGVTVSLGKLEFGAWGSYSISKPGADANENDLWASFTHSFESGASLSVGVTDYYFPNGGKDFLDEEAHEQELWASLSGPESLPLSIYAGLLLDSVGSLYAEVGAPLMEAEGVELAAHLGVVGGESAFYLTDGAAVVNVGVTASTELSITESFALPVSVSYVVNPSKVDPPGEVRGSRAYLFFGVSISP